MGRKSVGVLAVGSGRRRSRGCRHEGHLAPVGTQRQQPEPREHETVGLRVRSAPDLRQTGRRPLDQATAVSMRPEAEQIATEASEAVPAAPKREETSRNTAVRTRLSGSMNSVSLALAHLTRLLHCVLHWCAQIAGRPQGAGASSLPQPRQHLMPCGSRRDQAAAHEQVLGLRGVLEHHLVRLTADALPVVGLRTRRQPGQIARAEGRRRVVTRRLYYPLPSLAAPRRYLRRLADRLGPTVPYFHAHKAVPADCEHVGRPQSGPRRQARGAHRSAGRPTGVRPDRLLGNFW